MNATIITKEKKIEEHKGNLSPIFEQHFQERMELYVRRRVHQLASLQEEKKKIQSLITFSLELAKNADVILRLELSELDKLCDSLKLSKVNNSYNYLVNRPLQQYTRFSVEKAREDLTKICKKMDALHSSSPSDLWLADLQHLEVAVKKLDEERKSHSTKELVKRITGRPIITQYVQRDYAKYLKEHALKQLDIERVQHEALLMCPVSPK